jgi:hypothetical protein
VQVMRSLIIGSLLTVPHSESFPIRLRKVDEHIDEFDTLESFTIVTRSGYRFLVECTYEGRETEAESEK